MDQFYFERLGITVSPARKRKETLKLLWLALCCAAGSLFWVGVAWLFLWLGIRNWRPL